MSLDAESRRRYGRHVLLPEVGVAGQERLLAHVATVTGERRAAEVSALYLARAGVRVRVAPGEAAPSVAAGGRTELEAAAAFIAGAFAAIEEIKRVIGAGVPGRLPDGAFLTGPEDGA